jgi:hypothetical protein
MAAGTKMMRRAYIKYEEYHCIVLAIFRAAIIPEVQAC